MAITNLGNVSLKPKGEWSSNTSYLKNDIVSYQGSTYLAKSAPPAGTLPTNTTYWMLCAAKGTPGDAVPITEWSSSTAYSVGDKVAHEGSSYYCIQAHTNQEPPNATYWMVIGAKGEPGDVSTAQMNQAIEDALGPVASQLADIANLIVNRLGGLSFAVNSNDNGLDIIYTY